MSEETTTPAAPVDAAPAAPAAAPAAPQEPAGWDGKVESLDPRVQKMIADANAEAAKARVNAKASAADEARQELLKQLGLVKDDEKADPKELAEKLSAKDTQLRNLSIERALDKAARKAGADEDLLAAVLAHKGSLAGLDPAASDFASTLDALVKSELLANPKLKAVQVAAASGTELGGSGETGQITEQQLAAMSPEEKVVALRAGKLQHLL